MHDQRVERQRGCRQQIHGLVLAVHDVTCERQPGHAVDAAVARRHQGHREPLAGQLQRFTAALALLGELPVAAQLIGPAQRLQQIQVEAVAHPHAAAGQGCAGIGGEQRQAADGSIELVVTRWE